jgi:hypothetical protein
MNRLAALLVAGSALASCGDGAPPKQAAVTGAANGQGNASAPREDPLPAMREQFRTRFRDSLALLDGLAACEGGAAGAAALARQMRPIWAEEVRSRAAAARVEEDAASVLRGADGGESECPGADPAQTASLASFERLQGDVTRRLAAIADATRARSVAP